MVSVHPSPPTLRATRIAGSSSSGGTQSDQARQVAIVALALSGLLLALSWIPVAQLARMPTVGDTLVGVREGMRVAGFAIPIALALAYLITVGAG